MWYLTWFLGLLLSCAFTIIMVLWLENHDDKPLDSPQ
jgi:cyd operon protein YbgT